MKLKKWMLSISVILLFMLLGTTTVSANLSGFEFWYSTPGAPPGDTENSTYASFSQVIDGITYQMYCIGHGFHLIGNQLGKDDQYITEIGDSSTYVDKSITTTYYTGCYQYDDGTRAHTTRTEAIANGEMWTGMRETARFENTATVIVEDSQDLMYIFSATDENGTRIKHDEYLQWNIWGSNINAQMVRHYLENKLGTTNGHRYSEPERRLNEADAYKQFYEAIHDDKDNDTYPNTVEDVTDYTKVKVKADRIQKRYIVGPYKIKYLESTDPTYGPYTNVINIDPYTGKVTEFTQNYRYNGIKSQIKEIQDQRIDFNKIEDILVYDQDGNLLQDTSILRTQNQYSRDPDYAFPRSEEEFYIVVPYQGNEKMKSIYFDIQFKYLEKCIGEIYIFEGIMNEWSWEKKGSSVQEDCVEGKHREVTMGLVKRQAKESQPLLAVGPDTDRVYKTYTYRYAYVPDSPPPPPPHKRKKTISTTMQLGGFVFLDAKTGKASEVNNLLDKDLQKDELLKGIEVTLYEYDPDTKTSKLATLAQEYEEVPKGSYHYNEILKRGTEIRTNPTLTDSNGQYLFKGLDPMKSYYVVFTYNGEIYTNVAYKAEDPNNTPTQNWEVNSKATEGDTNRQNFNNQFGEIGSYPANYKITGNVLYPEAMVNKDGGYYNIAFHQEEVQDIYAKIEELIRTYITESTKTNSMGVASYPDLVKDIYSQIISLYNQDNLIKNKLQFIEDCKVRSNTGSNGMDAIDLYPRYDKIVIDHQYVSFSKYKLITVDRTTKKIKKVSDYNDSFTPIYPEQFYLNQGIKIRPTVDLALYKDVYKAKTTINGFEETYKYNKRVSNGKEFELGVKYEDIVNNYNHPQAVNLEDEKLEVRFGDIIPRSGNTLTTDGYSGNYHLSEEEKLHIYVTYKIVVENQSPTTASVTEIVDYYDRNYEYRSAYLGDDNGNLIQDLNGSDTSQYGAVTQTNSNKYKTVYIPIPERRLDNAERIYIYVTFEMPNASNTLESVAQNNEKLETTNLTEINGYKTYYSKTDTRTPGLIDIDSKPGNFVPDNYQKGITKFEDDENPAPAFVYVKREEPRTLTGTVFEDSTPNSEQGRINTGTYREGDGKLKDGEKGIKGAKVELIEYKNGNQEIRAVTYTNGEGNYTFTHYLPGNYVVRYTYGQEDKTVLTKALGGENEKSYNGQDFQSTVIRSNLMGYNKAEDKLQADRYWYAEQEKENGKVIRFSDAIDKYGNVDSKVTDLTMENTPEGTRSRTIAYSKTIDNYISRVLSSVDYGQMAEETRKLLNELEKQTYITAYTPDMTMEIEQVKKEIDSRADKGYIVNNVDFGIAERPRSLIEVKKEIISFNVKTQEGTDFLINADMDTKVEGTQIQKTSSTIAQSLYQLPTNGYRKKNYIQGFVDIFLDEELRRGATLEINYKVTVNNLSELDYVMGNYNNQYRTEENKVKTTANTVIDYVHNNLKLDTGLPNNEKWNEIIDPSANTQLVNDEETKTALLYEDRSKSYRENVETTRTTLKDFNSVALTDTLKTELLPNNSKDTTLTLTQVLTQSSDSDNFNYENKVEIINTSNTVGRRNYLIKASGNYNPKTSPDEPDSGETEKVVIAPPTGVKNYTTIMLVVGTMLVVLAGGIVLIKKKVLKK